VSCNVSRATLLIVEEAHAGEDPMTGEQSSAGRDNRRRDTDSRQRQALVGVRLSPEELATLKAVAARDGQTLPGALREGFLRHAAETR
jgi:hypothetical protein